MRIIYTYSTKLNGETIKHSYGHPYHVLLSMCGGKSQVIDDKGKIVSEHCSWNAATRKCSKLNKGVK